MFLMISLYDQYCNSLSNPLPDYYSNGYTASSQGFGIHHQKNQGWPYTDFSQRYSSQFIHTLHRALVVGVRGNSSKTAQAFLCLKRGLLFVDDDNASHKHPLDFDAKKIKLQKAKNKKMEQLEKEKIGINANQSLSGQKYCCPPPLGNNNKSPLI